MAAKTTYLFNGFDPSPVVTTFEKTGRYVNAVRTNSSTNKKKRIFCIRNIGNYYLANQVKKTDE